jgi:uncharacterized coiled-coil protein SlyX
MRWSDLERLAKLEAENAFQRQTLQTIRLVAEKAPPEEMQIVLRAIAALAIEALAQAESEAHEQRASG